MICYTHNTILDNLEFKKVRNKWLSDFRIHADDYLQFAPIAMVFASDILGVEGKNKFWDQCFILLKAQILTELFIQPLKYVTHVLRPDNSGYNSFPSGHTAEAFMAATFLHKEFGDRSIFYSLAGYSIASTVGLLRIANNRHWASDVFAGAAFGILATNLAYKIVPLKPTAKAVFALSIKRPANSTVVPLVNFVQFVPPFMVFSNTPPSPDAIPLLSLIKWQCTKCWVVPLV